MSAQARSKEIQALRALASLLVVIYHGHFVDGGYIGVDIFYVISGYLITGILVKQCESNSLKLSEFYAKRLKRLLPASLTVVVSTTILSLIFLPATFRRDLAQNIFAASTYISNFLFAQWNADYQNIGSTPPLFLHYWSLAVEEQFYLLWPLLIFVAYKIRGMNGVKVFVVAITISSFLFSLFQSYNSPIWAFYSVATRAWELGLGAALALGIIRIRARTLNFYLGITAVVASTILYKDSTLFPGFAALVPVCATLLLLSSDSWSERVRAVAKNRVIQYTGDISYSLYLWHWPVLIVPVYLLGRRLGVIEVIALIALTFLLAHLTFKYIENPLRTRNMHRKSVFTYASLITVMMVLLSQFVHMSYSDTFTIKNYGTYSMLDAKSKPETARDNCSLDYKEIVSPPCEYGDTKSATSVVLYGDSHADQWLPALDLIGSREGFKVIALIKKACPAAEVTKNVRGSYDVDLCQKFRDLSIERIKKIAPIAIIASGQQPEESPLEELSPEQWWLSGEERLLQRISSIPGLHIYISDTPKPHLDIPDCLARGRSGQCDKSSPVSPRVAEGFFAIDPTPWLCTTQCHAMVKDVIAYRDNSHISVAASRALAPELSAALKKAGLF